MNILFVLYGGWDTNSAIPLGLHARELERAGHRCAVTMPKTDAAPPLEPSPRAVTYAQALEAPAALFED